MDIPSSSSNAYNTLPQGFSVYQPALGTPLQFFPAIGTQELDEMLHAYLPGPAPISDKRAAVSVDFLEHLHLTGQTFKFYQVTTLASPVPVVSATSSPTLGSGASSSSGFPATPSWDFSNVSLTPSSTSSRSSKIARRSNKTSTPVSRHQTTDFSHLPGMKIMTRDGLDVTNSASRGSKTKEQRDHAHLMRIIKACDSCRAKKIRCDPSHKKRAAAASTASSSPAQSSSSSRPSKRVKSPPSPSNAFATGSITTPLAPLNDLEPVDLSTTISSWDFDATLALAGLNDLETSFPTSDTFWEELTTFPPATSDNDDLDFFLNPDAYVESGSSFASSSSSTSPSDSFSKSFSPHDDISVHDNQNVTSTVVTNREGSAGDGHGIIRPDLGVVTVAGGCSPISPFVTSSSVPPDDSFVPGPSGTVVPTMLRSTTRQSAHINDGVLALSATGTMLASTSGQHVTLLDTAEDGVFRSRVDDPGRVSIRPSSSKSTGDSPGPSIPSRVATAVVRDDVGSSLGEQVLSYGSVSSQLPTTPIEASAMTTTARPENPQMLPRSGPDRTVMDLGQNATPGVLRERHIVETAQNRGILGMLPTSETIVPELAYIMLSGTSDIIAALPPLSSSQHLATILLALSSMATSFMASAQTYLDQVDCESGVSDDYFRRNQPVREKRRTNTLVASPYVHRGYVTPSAPVAVC